MLCSALLEFSQWFLLAKQHHQWSPGRRKFKCGVLEEKWCHQEDVGYEELSEG